jgi:hypothetical protein
VTPFDTLFDEFHATAFRLEALPAYNVGSEESRLAAFREHRARPERSVRTSPWLARVAATTAAGKRWRRLRVLDEPITEYQRYQLLSGSYAESQTAGDETLLIHRRLAAPRLRFDSGQRPVRDFWLFDLGQPTERLVAMDYTTDGQFTGHRDVNDPAEYQAMLSIATELVEDAVPLAEYLASMEVGVA